jgi:hypothetical protein
MSENEAETSTTHSALRAIGWVSIGFGLAAVGVFLGHELHKRYRFNHRTPYDFYANAGSAAASEFGMGV